MANMFDTSAISDLSSNYNDAELRDMIDKLFERIIALETFIASGGVIHGNIQVIGDIHAHKFFKDEETDK